MSRIKLESKSVEQGLAKLVLTIIELLRQLLERQALRRIDQGSLSEDQIEQLGLTLMRLEEKMLELKLIFGLEEEELNIDLGPLGKLL
ncbi:gas vesicle protein K [Ammoniphilus sp. YIM 78166]|uniref:gas vesicle protein K n=1 Tax=Ammoniphilus sp. YIM 78166 TaxID=1644106 RepID=UPI00106F113D|nr:gas vesicle protein K [Ammoniphilus sp. YIM 78166]